MKIAQSLLTIYFERLLCIMIKFHVVEETKDVLLHFVQDFGLIYSFLTAKCTCIDISLLIDYSTHFKDVIRYYYSQLSSVSA